jgi:N,N-dimethylformamidase
MMDPKLGTGSTRRSQELPIVGYSDRLSVQPGDTISFMVSCESDTFAADVFRVTGGGPRPERETSPLQMEAVAATCAKRYPGESQCLLSGSYLEYGPLVESWAALTLVAWILPTLPATGRVQAILAHVGPDPESGFSLGIRGDGHLEVSVGGRKTKRWSLALPQALRVGSWYRVGVSVDSAGYCVLGQSRPRSHCDDGETLTVESTSVPASGLERAGWLSIGAVGDGNGSVSSSTGIRAGAFNGKVASPQLVRGSLDIAKMRGALEDKSTYLGVSMLSWPAPIEQAASATLHSGLRPKIFNSPLRAVTGPDWDGRHLDWRLSPNEYDAIWFHEDDMDDANWSPSFEWVVPVDSRCGLYGARVTTTDGEDIIPFFIRPLIGQPSARIAFLAPVFTYLAYSNSDDSDQTNIAGALPPHELTERERFVSRHPEVGRSLYDNHPDGSGIAHVSWLRPMLDVRLDHPLWSKGGSGRELSGDLYLIDWLEALEIPYDVFTDADLHSEGIELLSSYKVVITGGHPEYVSEPMLKALEQYVSDGGRMMYLGGNGFYWVTTIDPANPAILELRREHSGTRTWTGGPGEDHHSFTGEPGGLWRHRGRAPQRLTGVGFDAQGRGKSAPYVALPIAHDEKWSHIFAGVDLAGPIGDFGSNGEGAAGDELDRLDVTLGSPAGTTLLATSSGLHSDLYNRATEEVDQIDGSEGGTKCSDVRSDMTYFENGRGGAVFSVGSIAWSASLAHNNYVNSVSKITENVLRHFEGLGR